jgi:peptidoglycan/LPS O-acetylase OafA/YrhL
VRNQYVDLLRAAAIVRVVVYHTLGFWWLTVTFPAMGLMFALGGSLMAASLDRAGVRAIGRRMRRILPPVWLLGGIAVTAMFFVGGMHARWRLLLWVLPLSDPPASEWGAEWLAMIWYIRSYLWFIVLSPVLLWLFRRWSIPSLAVPFGVLVALVASGFGTGGTLRDFFLYAPAWMLGFAHHDGMLRRLSRRTLWIVVLALASSGLTLLFSSPGPRGYDLNDAPVADALWSTAFLLVLLSYAPKVLSLGRARPLVEAVNRRALTIYLWHVCAIGLVDFAAAVAGISLLGTLGGAIELAGVFAVVAVAMLAFGWVEDVAARRRPTLVPATADVTRATTVPQPVAV